MNIPIPGTRTDMQVAIKKAEDRVNHLKDLLPTLKDCEAALKNALNADPDVVSPDVMVWDAVSALVKVQLILVTQQLSAANEEIENLETTIKRVSSPLSLPINR